MAYCSTYKYFLLALISYMVSRIRQNKTFITIQSNMSPEPRERKSKNMQRWRETGLLADFPSWRPARQVGATL